MQIKELKEIIKDFPDDADIILEKRVDDKNVIYAAILTHRKATKDDHNRLVLSNMKPIKRRPE